MPFLVTRLAITAMLVIMALPVNAQDDPIVCPRIGSTDATSMTLDSGDDDYIEISGLGFSPNQVGPSGFPLFYAVNDQSARGQTFGMFDSGTGQFVQSIQLPVASVDFESLAVGSCGEEDGGNCIYVADVGDGKAMDSQGTISERSSGQEGKYPIYKIKEPKWQDFQDGAVVLPESYVTTLWFNYSHASSPTQFANCEAVFLDNVGWGGGAVGDFYLITKWGGEESQTLNRLFKIPADVWTLAKNDPNFVYSPEAVGFYDKGEQSNPLMGHTWTRAEMTLDGTLIALGDYRHQYLFLRCPGKSVVETIALEGSLDCAEWDIGYEKNSKFETIAWTPDKSKTLEISECASCNRNVPMVWTTMDYTAGTQTCPTFRADITTTSATTTTTTTMTTASTTSTSIAATVEPTPNHDNCVLDADGTFGNVSSDAVPVSFYFELETDPASGASLHEVMNMLERTILVDLLPDIFGNNCNIPTNRLLRSSTFVPVGASVGPGATLVLGENCSVPSSDGDECVVLQDTLQVYGKGNEYDSELLLRLVKESMDGGSYDNAHPSIVRVSYLGQSPSLESPQEQEKHGLFLLVIIPCSVIIVLSLAVIILNLRKAKARVSVGDSASSVDGVVQPVPEKKLQENEELQDTGMQDCDSLEPPQHDQWSLQGHAHHHCDLVPDANGSPLTNRTVGSVFLQNLQLGMARYDLLRFENADRRKSLP
jgi:hypothetical protein